MKTKRLSAVVLCLILAGGIVCGAMVRRAEASAYLDKDTIGRAYVNAIDAMTARGVLNGFPDGNFQPLSGLTRGQGAKIVAYLILGAEAAARLRCDAAPYSDVPADLWSAPAVAWCTGKGIIHGMGDGSFKPEDPLTGQQFAKMLLCAFKLGDPARYVGDGWEIRVTQDAESLGLLEGDAGMCTHRPILRQQAALMAYNALKIAEAMALPPSPETTEDPAPEDDPPPDEDPTPEDDDDNETSMMTDF